MKLFILIVSFLTFGGNSAFSQVNYVLNPDFETYSGCPNNNDQIYLAKYWSSIDTVANNTFCAPDYAHICASGIVNSVPAAGTFWQYPRSGNGMAEALMYNDQANLNFYPFLGDYLQGRLYKKLTSGKTYCVTFYVCLQEVSRYGIKDISAYLDNGSIDTIRQCGKPQTQYTPQVTSSSIVTDTMNWTRIQGSFVANGTEKFITIGNFKDKAHTTASPFLPTNGYNTTSPVYAYYLIDDVSVIESDLPADAGPNRHIGKGDSTYIGRPNEIGLECTWNVLGNPAVIGTGAGLWVKPAVPTSYVVTQTLCGNVKRDTVTVEVWGVGMPSVRGQAQRYELSPNPSHGVIEFHQAVGDPLPVDIMVEESSGKQVYKGKTVFDSGSSSLDLTALSTGFYYVSLKDSYGGTYTLKLAKQ